jgi:hypothetical protein
MGIKAYIDNNIIVDLENQAYSIEAIKKLIPSKDVEMYYSYTHIKEAQNFAGVNQLTRSEFLNKRFNSIRELTGNRYLYISLQNNRILYTKEDPQIVFNTITEFSWTGGFIKGALNLNTKEQKAGIRDEMGIDASRINNYHPHEVVEQLNKKLHNWGDGQSFLELINYGISLIPNNEEYGTHNRFAAIFELLDFLGYWKDKETIRSNEARLWDSQHAHFASYCDYFISNDKRTRYKAEVVYDIFNVNTKIISI